MNKFDTTLKTLTDKLGQDESKEVKEALGYLKSLKPELPKFVADWACQKTVHGIYKKLYLDDADALNGEDKKVREWFAKYTYTDRNLFLNNDWLSMELIVNMTQFGEVVKEDMYYIRAPKEWDEHETPYVCSVDCVPDAYALTMHRQYADKFTKEEAVATMRKLRVNWHLEKAEDDDK